MSVRTPANVRAENRIERMRAAFSPQQAPGPEKPQDILLDVLSGELRHKEVILQDIRNELTSIETENTRLSKENAELTAQVSQSKDLNTELDSALRMISTDVTSLQRRLTAARRANTDLQSYRLALNQLRSQVETLQKEESEVRRLQSVKLQEAEAKRVNSLMDSIRDVMTRATAEILPQGGLPMPTGDESPVLQPPFDRNRAPYSPSLAVGGVSDPPPVPRLAEDRYKVQAPLFNRASLETKADGPPRKLFTSLELERNVQHLLDTTPKAPSASPISIRNTPHSVHYDYVPRPPSASPPPADSTAFDEDAEIHPDIHSAFITLKYECRRLAGESVRTPGASLPQMEDLLYRIRLLKLQV